MQGTPNTNGSGPVLDLNALLAERRLEPVQVLLGDATYMVNTDLTAHEANAFISLMKKGNDAPAFTILVGSKEERANVVAAVDRAAKSTAKNAPRIHASDEATALDKFIDALPRMHQALVSGQLMRASKALAEFAKTDDQIYEAYGYGTEPAGKSTAS
jgi:hypothetical protein